MAEISLTCLKKQWGLPSELLDSSAETGSVKIFVENVK